MSKQYPSPTRLTHVALTLILAVITGTASAGTDETSDSSDTKDSMNLLVGTVLAHENNLFHLPPGTNAQQALGKPSGADSANINYFGVLVDKAYSEQRFQLDARITNYRYDTYRYLDSSANKYQGSWQWALTHYLTGSLESGLEQSLVNFADSLDYTRRNTRSAKSDSFNVDGDLSGGWHLIGKTAQFRRKDTYSIVAEGDFQQKSNEAGLKYVETSGSSLALVARTTTGEYTDRINDPVLVLDKHYTQHDAELRGRWLFSGKSVLQATLTHLKRQHDQFAQRDYAGTARQITYQLTPTGKLNFQFGSKREITSYQELSSSYVIAEDVDATATWTIYPKTTMRFKLEASHRDYFGAIVPLPDPRKDRFHSTQFGLEWLPLKNLTLTANLQHDRRSSNRSAYEYAATSSSLAAQLIF